MKFHGNGWQNHLSHWDKPTASCGMEVVELGSANCCCRDQGLPGELVGSTSLLRPWLWQSPGTFPVKINGRIVGQVLLCVGNETSFLQALTGTGEVFHSSICFWDIGLQDFLYMRHLRKAQSQGSNDGVYPTRFYFLFICCPDWPVYVLLDLQGTQTSL